LLEKEEDVMMVTDAMPVDRIRNIIASEWTIDIDSMEGKGRVTLSTFRDWHMPHGKFELQKSITRLSKKLEQSLQGQEKALGVLKI
jgi:hypothetical protein